MAQLSARAPSLGASTLMTMPEGATNERFYRPRAAWVWDSDRNPNLEARVDLRVALLGYGAEAAVQSWLDDIGACGVGDAENVYVRGGCAIEIEQVTSDRRTSLLLSSGGQDALESLDELVLTVHEAVLVPHPDLGVQWEELPIEPD